MDRAELNQKLENFRQACIKQGCVDTDKDALIIEESFPGLKPTPFFVYVNVKEQWLNGKHHRTVLKELDELLYKTADDQTLENILALRLGKPSAPSDTLVSSTLEDRIAA
jgi:hypothetical protein